MTTRLVNFSVFFTVCRTLTGYATDLPHTCTFSSSFMAAFRVHLATGNPQNIALVTRNDDLKQFVPLDILQSFSHPGRFPDDHGPPYVLEV